MAEMETMNPFQQLRLHEIESGRRFWGYLDTEALRTRYVLAAHFVRAARHIVEIGGYRQNVVTNFLCGLHESVTVYSLDAEFEPLEKDDLNGMPCRVRHIRDFFQNHTPPSEDLAVVALGLEVHGALEPFYELARRADRIVVEIPVDHQPSVECFSSLRAHVDLRVSLQINLDLSPNEAILSGDLRETNMNTPFWKRHLYVLDTFR